LAKERRSSAAAQLGRNRTIAYGIACLFFNSGLWYAIQNSAGLSAPATSSTLDHSPDLDQRPTVSVPDAQFLSQRGSEGAMMAEAKIKGYRIEVEILTDIYKITGTLFVPLAGVGVYSARLSDFLNNTDKQFLALTDAKVEALPEPNEKLEAPFLAVNKSVVTMVRAIEGE
jgi:hypothetical protein